jgi:hypothetical protein
MQHIPNLIVKIMTSGSRIFVGDVQESWHFIKFKAEQNQMVVFADDTVPRFVTTGCVLDYDTICGYVSWISVLICACHFAPASEGIARKVMGRRETLTLLGLCDFQGGQVWECVRAAGTVRDNR